MKFQRRTGQALVELALSLPILMFLAMGILEYGLYFQDQYRITNAAAEGARAASIGAPTYDITNQITNTAGSLIHRNNSGITNGAIVLEFSNDSTNWLAWPANYVYTNQTQNPVTNNGVTNGAYIRVTTATKHYSLASYFSYLNNTYLTSKVVIQREP